MMTLLFGNPQTVTDDLGLAAYLVTQGAKVEKTELRNAKFRTLTLSHWRMQRLIHNYFRNKPIRIAPMQLFTVREKLKFL